MLEWRKIGKERGNVARIDFDNIIGKKYNMLTVLEYCYTRRIDKTHKAVYYKCKCDCGNEIVINIYKLTNNSTKSCGCLHRKMTHIAVHKVNKYEFKDDYVIGYTTNTNKPFYVDIEDYDKIADMCWAENDQGYIISNSLNRKSAVRLHRFILGLDKSDKRIIDHRNNKRYDNRKENLRFSDKQTNGINRPANKNNKLGYKGIFLNKNGTRYCARIMVNHKNIHLGTFDTLEEAIRARKDAEIKYFGEFAYDETLQ